MSVGKSGCRTTRRSLQFSSIPFQTKSKDQSCSLTPGCCSDRYLIAECRKGNCSLHPGSFFANTLPKSLDTGALFGPSVAADAPAPNRNTFILETPVPVRHTHTPRTMSTWSGPSRLPACQLFRLRAAVRLDTEEPAGSPIMGGLQVIKPATASLQPTSDRPHGKSRPDYPQLRLR